jgi:hypothetical protein
VPAKVRPRPIADGITPADAEGRAWPDARHLRRFSRKCRMVWHPGRRQYIAFEDVQTSVEETAVATGIAISLPARRFCILPPLDHKGLSLLLCVLQRGHGVLG